LQRLTQNWRDSQTIEEILSTMLIKEKRPTSKIYLLLVIKKLKKEN
jgi:hypothetical protein